MTIWTSRACDRGRRQLCRCRFQRRADLKGFEEIKRESMDPTDHVASVCSGLSLSLSPKSLCSTGLLSLYVTVANMRHGLLTTLLHVISLFYIFSQSTVHHIRTERNCTCTDPISLLQKKRMKTTLKSTNNRSPGFFLGHQEDCALKSMGCRAVLSHLFLSSFLLSCAYSLFCPKLPRSLVNLMGEWESCD